MGGGGDCYKVGAAAFVLAQLAWAVSSLHEAAQPEGSADMAGHRTLAFGTIGLAAALSGASLSRPSLAMPAATVCLLSTATTAWYASKLNPRSAISRTGYGAALFSTAASLLLLTADLSGRAEGACRGEEGLVIVARADAPPAYYEVADGYSDGYGHGDGYGDGHGHGDGYGDGYGHRDGAARAVEFRGWRYVDADDDYYSPRVVM